MKTKTIRTRRKFRSEWDEINYLRDKVLYWFYEREDQRKALRFCDRLQTLVERASADHESILGEECWALLCEIRGDLTGAIAYREHEIEQIKKLFRISAKSTQRDFIFQTFDYSDLGDRLDLLAILYHDTGNLKKAVVLLKESRQLCKRHRIPFEGEDLLRDYLAE
jgi:hypothetical protein